MALRDQQGCRIAANYGLNPQLGKYHRTTCLNGHLLAHEEAQQAALNPAWERSFRCLVCGSKRLVRGVHDRIEAIADRSEDLAKVASQQKPPYHYQIPLEYIPGIGSKTLEKLLAVFHTEMNVLHQATVEQLRDVIGSELAERLHAARSGEVKIQSGGGGIYGRIERG